MLSGGSAPRSGVPAAGSVRYIVLQDVVEHVEDARVLFSELNNYLKPGGYILVRTPTADDISLSDYARH